MGLVSNKMGQDWNAYWSGSKAGDNQQWVNGTLTRNDDGSATYKRNDGSSVNFNQGTSIDELASGNKDIANAWGNTYGYKPDSEVKIPEFKMPTAATGGGPGAVTRSVTDNELTSSNLTKLLQGDSPYIKQAMDRSLQTMGERGLVNSSLAAGAGTAAAIDAALPIASADASAYGTAARDNQSAQNNFNLADKQAANSAAIASMQLQGQANLAEIAAARQEKLADKQFGQQFQLQQSQNDFNSAQLDKQQKFQLDQLKINMDLAYDKMTLDQTNTYAQGYLNIVNSNMPAEDKAIALSGYSAIYGFHDGATTDTAIDLSALPEAGGG